MNDKPLYQSHEAEKWFEKYLAAQKTIEGLRSEVERLTRERDEARQDVIDAAGELLLPIAEPGSDMAKLMSANSIMRRQRNEARQERDRYREALEKIQEGNGNYLEICFQALRPRGAASAPGEGRET